MNRFLLLFMLISGSVFAQTQEQSRKYYGDKESANVEGSPFLFEDFKLADIIDKAGKVYLDQNIKYNLYTQEAVFRNEQGELQKFGNPFSEIRIKGFGTLRNGFSNPLFGGANTLYEVLFQDKVQLLKAEIRKIEDGPLGYNDAHPPRKYVSEVKYFVVINNKWTDVTKSKKNILKAFGDKSPSINEYLSKNKLNISDQNDLISLVTYGNTLL